MRYICIFHVNMLGEVSNEVLVCLFSKLDKEIKLFYHTKEWTRELLETQYEWLIVNMTVANKTVTDFEVNQTVIVYTVSINKHLFLKLLSYVFFFNYIFTFIFV